MNNPRETQKKRVKSLLMKYGRLTSGQIQDLRPTIMQPPDVIRKLRREFEGQGLYYIETQREKGSGMATYILKKTVTKAFIIDRIREVFNEVLFSLNAFRYNQEEEAIFIRNFRKRRIQAEDVKKLIISLEPIFKEARAIGLNPSVRFNDHYEDDDMGDIFITRIKLKK